MFTGLIEEMGVVKELTYSQNDKDQTSCEMKLGAAKVLDGVQLGDSIACAGVCLTVTAFDGNSFKVGLAPETLAKTNLSDLAIGSQINLERATLPTTRLGGHYVQGHVDDCGEIIDLTPDEDALWVKIRAPHALMKYIVTKGFIAIDGTSLTVCEVGNDWFNVTLIAYTQSHITLPKKSIGDQVNLEVDILAKYVEKAAIYNKEFGI